MIKGLHYFYPQLRKIFPLIFLLIAVFHTGALAQVWAYNFGSGNSFLNAPGFNTSFLPAPMQGSAFVNIGSGNGSFTLANPGSGLGSESELQVVGSSDASLNKFGIHGYPAGTTSYMKFSLQFSDNTAGDWYFYNGSGTSFSNDASVEATEAFTGLKWSFDEFGDATVSLQEASGWTTLPPGSFVQGNDYKLEIFSNNSDQPLFYDKNGAYLVADNAVDIWINDVLVVNDGQKISIPDKSDIDSWTFYSQNANTTATLLMDDILYSNDITIKVLPVHFDHLSIASLAQGIALDWENMTEADIAGYTIERSDDGNHFSAIGEIRASLNNGSKAAYRFVDPAPGAGNNFYRIKARQQDGKKYYSAVLRIRYGSSQNKVTISPNPVVNHQMNIEFSGLPKGKYVLTVFNTAQVEQARKTIEHNGGSHSETVELPSHLARGIYHVRISNGSNSYDQTILVD
jgi:hypothetical protein